MPVAKEMRVLIVDDQASMRQLMVYSLGQMEISNVMPAKSGRDALTKMQTSKFDLIISDWNMEDIDGLQLLKFIRGNPVIAKMPFIMSTGNKEKAKVRIAVQAGVNNYIVKPFNVTKLKEKIEAVVGPLT